MLWDNLTKMRIKRLITNGILTLALTGFLGNSIANNNELDDNSKKLENPQLKFYGDISQTQNLDDSTFKDSELDYGASFYNTPFDYQTYFKELSAKKFFKKSKKKDFLIEFINPLGSKVNFLSNLFYANLFKTNKVINTEFNLYKMPKMAYTTICNLNSKTGFNFISQVTENYSDYYEDLKNRNFYDFTYEGRISHKTKLNFFNLQPYLPIKITYSIDNPSDYEYTPRISEIGKGVIFSIISPPQGLIFSANPYYSLRRFGKETYEGDQEKGQNIYLGVKNSNIVAFIKSFGITAGKFTTRPIADSSNFKKHYNL